MNKFLKKNWKKLIIIIASLIIFCIIIAIGLIYYTIRFIPVKKIGEIETYGEYPVYTYVCDTKERFFERLETWENDGWAPEDIAAIREKLQQYDEDNVLIVFCSRPVNYLYYYKDEDLYFKLSGELPMVSGSYDSLNYEQETKINIYITDYEEKIFQWQWG